eukprot:SAG31_NODE_803_length_12003_cov_25.248593_10_plen_39_part_00
MVFQQAMAIKLSRRRLHPVQFDTVFGLCVYPGALSLIG